VNANFDKLMQLAAASMSRPPPSFVLQASAPALAPQAAIVAPAAATPSFSELTTLLQILTASGDTKGAEKVKDRLLLIVCGSVDK